MKNIQISEILSQENIPLSYENSSIMDLINTINLNKNISAFYFINSLGKYLGVIHKKEILKYIIPYSLFIERNNTADFISKLAEISISELVDSDVHPLTLEDAFPVVLSEFSLHEYSSMPVIDSNGDLIGEVTQDSILSIVSKVKCRVDISA